MPGASRTRGTIDGASICELEHRSAVRTHVRYMLALFAGLLLIICIPEISRALPRFAGLIR